MNYKVVLSETFVHNWEDLLAYPRLNWEPKVINHLKGALDDAISQSEINPYFYRKGPMGLEQLREANVHPYVRIPIEIDEQNKIVVFHEIIDPPRQVR